MSHARRFLSEYSDLARTLSYQDFALLLIETALNAPSVLRTKVLTAVDSAMSRDMIVRFCHSRLTIPVSKIDRLLAGLRDSPTFGTVREMYARNCYLKYLHLEPPVRAVLDLGANRGMFSLLALVHLGAEIVVGVEPRSQYAPIFELLLNVNECAARKAPRYRNFVGSRSSELAKGDEFVSIPTILREQSIERFDLVKMDIEGGEKDVFAEPEWLNNIDNLTMELHPQFAGDLSLIPAALEEHGFTYRLMDQEGSNAPITRAMFLIASRNPSYCLP